MYEKNKNKPVLDIQLVAKYKVKNTTPATVEDCLAYIDSKDVLLLGFDTETTGLDPHLSKIVMFQIGDLSKQFVIDARTEDITPLLPVLQDKSKTKVLVNAKFDYKMVLGNYGVRMESVRDCMLQEQLILGSAWGSLYNLEVLADKYTSYTYQKEQLSLFSDRLTKDIGKSFLTIGDDPFSKEQVEYGALDVILPILIDEQQRKIMKRDNINPDIENEFVLCVGDAEYKGFYLSKDKWVELYEEKLTLFEKQKKILQKHLDALKWKDEINWNSPKQVTKLFKSVGISTTIQKKIYTLNGLRLEESESVDANVLKKYEEAYPIVYEYLKYKELSKDISSYGLKFLEHIHPKTGRIHTSYRQILNTGRISSRGPSLLNIKKDSEYRQCFGPQSEVTTMIVCDYSSQETRILAELSQDKALLEFFRTGDGDFHSFMTRRILGVDVHSNSPEDLELIKANRQVTKRLNFCIPYGGGAYKVAIILDETIERAEELINMWFDGIPGVRSYFSRAKDFAKKNGFLVLDRVVGRRYYLPQYSEYLRFQDAIETLKRKKIDVPKLYWSKLYKSRGSLERTAQNYPIQGTGASMTKLAAILFRRWILSNNYQDRIYMVNFIHDEIVVECFKYLAAVAAKELERCMMEAGAHFCKKVKMLADADILPSWKKK